MNDFLDLNNIVDNIQSRAEFIAFLHGLIDDFQEKTDEWENSSLERYLEALAAWIEDMDGYFLNKEEDVPKKPSWKLLGQMLLAAKYYE